ncbi:MAG: HIT family protein [Patescibacteria group bacterium]
MDNCIFCKIVKGEIESAKVYEDEDALALLDINPISRGHTLLISKKHFKDIFSIDEEALKKIIVAGKNVAAKLKNSLGADGINFLQSNGKSAGQIVFHYHLHVIPRYENDGLKKHGLWGEVAKETDIADLKKIAEEIKKGF